MKNFPRNSSVASLYLSLSLSLSPLTLSLLPFRFCPLAVAAFAHKPSRPNANQNAIPDVFIRGAAATHARTSRTHHKQDSPTHRSYVPLFNRGKGGGRGTVIHESWSTRARTPPPFSTSSSLFSSPLLTPCRGWALPPSSSPPPPPTLIAKERRPRCFLMCSRTDSCSYCCRWNFLSGTPSSHPCAPRQHTHTPTVSSA